MKYFFKFTLLLLLCLCFAAIQSAKAQTLPAGPQVLNFFSDADDTEQPYGLYLPKNYDPQKKYPLVVMLHGAGSNHRLALRRVFGKSNFEGESDVEASRYFPEFREVDYIVATPFARGTAGYQGIPEKDVYDMLADVKKRFSIDEDRTYLTGLSMGGGGTLWLGLTRPDIWAAIAPVCPAPPQGSEALAENAGNYPVYFFQGEADPAVKAEGTRAWAKRMQDLGIQVKYDEYPGVQHDSWVQAYKDGFIFDWFKNYKRNRFPEQVRYASSQYKYNKAYWVMLDAFTPGVLTKIDAKFTQTNKLEIATINLEAFTLNLLGHPKYIPGKVVELTIDGKKLKTQGGNELSFSKQKGKWSAQKYAAPVVAKKAGAEGPVLDAFSRRHVYVYGTQGNPGPDELKARRELALQAANWSAYRGEFLGRIKFFPRVLADNEVRPSDLESSNLILFGTKETNSIIAKYSEQLPIHLNTTAVADHGLFYVFPVTTTGRCIAVSSGLPWWAGQEQEGYPFLLPMQRSLSEFKDFILFKGKADTVLSQGYFDNNWKLKPADIKLMNESGAVKIKQTEPF